MFNWLEIQYWRIAKWLIRKGYGADCNDYAKECVSCRAVRVIEWIDGHIELLK